jgi:hypothetical protein
MRRWRRFAGDEGTASLEFITAGMVLLVPVVYLVIALAGIQAGAFAVEGASRQAARVFVEATTEEEARAGARLAVEFALADYGIAPEAASIAISCSPRPDDCLARRGFVTVDVEARVALPLVPAALDVDAPGSVTLRSSATQRVSRFSEAP